jgi:mono/diheme cytochrome c family protein
MNDQDIEYKRAYTAGAVIYQDHCQNCHGNNGEGLSALNAPANRLCLSETEARHQLACILKYRA